MYLVPPSRLALLTFCVCRPYTLRLHGTLPKCLLPRSATDDFHLDLVLTLKQLQVSRISVNG